MKKGVKVQLIGEIFITTIISIIKHLVVRLQQYNLIILCKITIYKSDISQIQLSMNLT